MAGSKGRKPASLWASISEWYAEIALLIGILACAFAVVALSGYVPGDPTWMRPSDGRVENPCGPLGANVAAGLHWLLGVGAWSVIVPGVLCALALAGRPLFRPVRGLGWSAVFVAVLAALDLALRPEMPVELESWAPIGGAVGAMVSLGLQGVVGPVGAWIVLLGSVAVLLTLLVHIEWGPITERAIASLEARIPVIRSILVAAARVGGRAGLATGRGISVLAVKGASSVAPVGKAGVERLGSAVRRMGESLVRQEEVPFPELAGLNRDLVAEAPAPAVGDFNADPNPTIPLARAELAEVEWEPTAFEPASPTQAPSQVLGMFPELAPRTSRATQVGASTSVPEAPAASTQAVPALRTTRNLGATPPNPPVELDSPEDIPEVDDFSAADPTEEAAEPPPVPKLSGPAPALVVHQNPLLDEKIRDDGRAVVRAKTEFQLPPLSLLDEVPQQKAVFDEEDLRKLAALVEEKLLSFKIGGKITGIRPGPVVTIFEFLPDDGIKVSRIVGLADDLKMALRTVSVRIVAPIPGKGVVGIEIPSPTRLTIYLRELLASNDFRGQGKALPCIIGKDVEGKPMVADIATMPHLLVGGTTGSGKSVGVNGMLMSLVFTKTPDELRLLLVDPKKLEFEMYHSIPHLLYPILTEPAEAAAALAWACREMDDRYELLARWSVRNIIGYNTKVERELADWTAEKARKYAPKGWTEDDGPLSMPKKLPYIVVIIDELADLMMVAGKEVEESICRIAQKARACGIHLVVATQRPSVDVITGLIKANLPTRMSFQLRNRIDSRTVLDSMGAEALLGRGDLLFMPPGIGSLIRCHAAFVSDEEVGRVTDFLRGQADPEYIEEIVASAAGDSDIEPSERDDLYDTAVRICVQAGKASTSLVQRHLKIGYNRAANIIEQMEAAGVVGPADGARPRQVLITANELDSM